MCTLHTWKMLLPMGGRGIWKREGNLGEGHLEALPPQSVILPQDKGDSGSKFRMVFTEAVNELSCWSVCRWMEMCTSVWANRTLGPSPFLMPGCCFHITKCNNSVSKWNHIQAETDSSDTYTVDPEEMNDAGQLKCRQTKAWDVWCRWHPSR